MKSVVGAIERVATALENSSGGGGGGGGSDYAPLIVNTSVSEGYMVMDKTAKEVYDACISKLVIVKSPTGSPIVVTAAMITGNAYRFGFTGIGSAEPNMEFAATGDDAYPKMYIGG